MLTPPPCPAVRTVLSPDERRSLCAAVVALLPLLQPADHYLPLVRPLAAALGAGAAPPTAALAALGPSLGGRAAGRAEPHPTPAESPQTPTMSLAAAVRQQGRQNGTGRDTELPAPDSGRPASPGPADGADDAERTAAGTPPPPEDDDAVMGSQEAMDPAAVLDLFQAVWAYVNTCW